MWATGTVSLRNVVLVAHTGPIWVDSVNIKFLSQVLDRWYRLDKKMCKGELQILLCGFCP